MEHEAWIVPLKLRHPFGISRGTASELPTVLLRLGSGPHLGLGEAAPVRYLGRRAPDILAGLSALCTRLPEPDPGDISRELPADTPAPVRAALDVALWDRSARAADRTLRAELDLRSPPALATTASQTSYTIALDTLEAMAERAAEASHLPQLSSSSAAIPRSTARPCAGSRLPPRTPACGSTPTAAGPSQRPGPCCRSSTPTASGSSRSHSPAASSPPSPMG